MMSSNFRSPWSDLSSERPGRSGSGPVPTAAETQPTNLLAVTCLSSNNERTAAMWRWPWLPSWHARSRLRDPGSTSCSDPQAPLQPLRARLPATARDRRRTATTRARPCAVGASNHVRTPASSLITYVSCRPSASKSGFRSRRSRPVPLASLGRRCRLIVHPGGTCARRTLAMPWCAVTTTETMREHPPRRRQPRDRCTSSHIDRSTWRQPFCVGDSAGVQHRHLSGDGAR
jgi:hypothetical protein